MVISEFPPRRFLLSRIPGNYYVFGENGRPHPTRAWGRGYAWRHLRRCLEVLRKEGRIEPAGISPYSFKDTGITDWLKLLPLPAVMQQAGHTNPSTTMIYNLPDLVNEGFRKIRSKIVENDL